MSRSRSVLFLIGCSIAASCVRPPAPAPAERGPASATSAHTFASSPVQARGSDSRAASAVDMGWLPYSTGPIAMFNRNSGNAGNPGPFRYHYRYPPGTSVGARRYSVDLRVTVRTGSEFIVMGNLDEARVQRFDAGTTFVIPAGTWHVEWFETETLVEVEGVGPRQIEVASPATSRVVMNRDSGASAARAGRADEGPSPAVDVGWGVLPGSPPSLLRPLPGDPSRPGMARYYLKTLRSASLGAHRHSADMRVTVLSGRQFILMGELESARVQRFDPGATFVIPAGAWHVEWFESETLVEIEIDASWQTEWPSPETPRVP